MGKEITLNRAARVVTPLILLFGVIFLGKNIAEFAKFYDALEFKFLLAATILASVANALAALKLAKTMEYSLSLKVNFFEWMDVYIRSYLLNNVIPFLGVAYRGRHLKRNFSLGYTDYVFASYLFAVSGILMLLFFAATFFLIHDENYLFITIFLAAIPLTFIKFFYLSSLSNLPVNNVKIRFYLQKLSILQGFLETIFINKKFIKFFLLFFAGALIDFLVFAGTFFSLKQSIALDSLVYIYLAYSFSWLVRIVPGNIGIQEVIVASAGMAVGLDAFDGVILSLCLRLVNIFGALLLWGGVACIKKIK